MSTSNSTPGEPPVLITGATGFLGSYLLRSLIKSGHQNIRALRRPNSDNALVADLKGPVEWVEGDLLDPASLEDAMQGIRQVYHCAAVVSFDPRKAKTMLQVNIEGTANVVNAALWEGVDKLVHVSSIAAIGRSPEEIPLCVEDGAGGIVDHIVVVRCKIVCRGDLQVDEDRPLRYACPTPAAVGPKGALSKA